MRLPGWLGVVLLALAVLRVGGVVASAVSNTHGDYYASLPGAYVRTVNPVLWDSPDMLGAMGYHRDTYYHGPVQYLTLYAVAFLDSYKAIAWLLLPIYAGAVAVAIGLQIRTARQLAPGASLGVPFIVSTLLFFPLLQSYLQREFEVVILLGLTAALWCSVTDRRSVVGAALAYIAWFKYVPLLFVGYLALRRWFRALAVFAITSIAILIIAHLAFDLSLFVNNNVPAHAAQVMNLASYAFQPDAAGELVGFGFCTGWFASETTLANIRHGLCSVSARWPWFPANLAYVLLCVGSAVSYLLSHARFERDGHVAGGRERWRRALEFSIVTTICACFFFAHYYYLIVLVVPLNMLLARYVARANYRRLTAWLFCYVLLSAFLVPTSMLSWLLDVDVWARYIQAGWFLYGELLLVALLLLEYSELSRTRTASGERAGTS